MATLNSSTSTAARCSRSRCVRQHPCQAWVTTPRTVYRLTRVHASKKFETVSDIITQGRPVYTCTPDDSVERALELLVEMRISGLPVVDEESRVVGVVSDFDLLALESSGRTNKGPLFPETSDTWQAFKNVRKAVTKGTGRLVRDVMTSPAWTVRENTNIDDATRLLLQKRIRRLPVVDADGKIMGMISRSNIIAAVLELRKAAV